MEQQLLRSLLQTSSLSLRDLAGMTGIPYQTLCDYESGVYEGPSS
jgi:hypothetical protein